MPPGVFHDPKRPVRAFGRIGIVDDNPDDVFFLQRQLRRIGLTCPICTFGDGCEVMSFLRQIAAENKPDLLPEILFLDLNMPGATGFSVLCWIREQEFLKNIKVLILSGSGDPGDVTLATELSADAFVPKSPSPAQLEKLLERFTPDLLPVKPRPHRRARPTQPAPTSEPRPALARGTHAA